MGKPLCRLSEKAMWRSFAGRCVANCICRVPAAFQAARPVATQRWSSSIKMTKQLKKMLDRRGGSKKKKAFPGSLNLHLVKNPDAGNEFFNFRRKTVYTEDQKRRAYQVGRVLYDNIVHLINSGEVAPQLAAHSVEIVQVKIVPDFSSVNVYWLASGSEKDNTIEALLKDSAGRLRQLLTSQYILGSIPRINFVCDNSQARYMEVVTLLKKADFGPDFVPTKLGASLRENIITMRREGQLSPVDKLQSTFDSFDQQGYSQRHQECSSISNFSCKVPETSELQRGETQSTTPLSLDVHELGKQFFCDSAAVSSRTFTTKQDRSSVTEGFRDNLYGVPRTELINKILFSRQKAGTRPSTSFTQDSELFKQTLQSSGFKLPFQKKASMKTKGRHKMQKDYFQADFEEEDVRNDYMEEEEEEMFDEERDELNAHVPGTDDKPHIK